MLLLAQHRLAAIKFIIKRGANGNDVFHGLPTGSSHWGYHAVLYGTLGFEVTARTDSYAYAHGRRGTRGFGATAQTDEVEA